MGPRHHCDRRYGSPARTVSTGMSAVLKVFSGTAQKIAIRTGPAVGPHHQQVTTHVLAAVQYPLVQGSLLDGGLDWDLLTRACRNPLRA